MAVHVHGYDVMQLVVHVHQNEVATVWMIPFLYHIDIQHSAEIFNTLHVPSLWVCMCLLCSLAPSPVGQQLYSLVFDKNGVIILCFT